MACDHYRRFAYLNVINLTWNYSAVFDKIFIPANQLFYKNSINTFPALYDRSPLKTDRLIGVDFLVVRELTGGIYFGEPRGLSENGEKAFDTCVYTSHEVKRVADMAVDLARKRSKRICAVDKANVLATSRLWRREMQKIASDNPDIDIEYLFVDNASMQLILRPNQFDVIVTENMFGDILTDEASVLPGSIGLLPSASVGDSTAVFEPIHGSFPEGAGKGIANPFGMIRSVALMLDIQFGLKKEAGLIEEAVEAALEQKVGTPDLYPESPVGTSEAGQWIANYIQQASL